MCFKILYIRFRRYPKAPLVQLRPRRNPVVHHQKVQPFFSILLVHRGDQHPTGIDPHHLAGRQVDDGDGGLSDQLFRLVILVDAA